MMWMGGIRKFGKALLLGQLYSKGLEEKVLKMRDVAKNLREEAKLCLHESLRLIKDDLCPIAGVFTAWKGLLPNTRWQTPKYRIDEPRYPPRFTQRKLHSPDAGSDAD